MSAPAIRWLDLAALMAEPPPPVPWIVQPLVARGHITMLAGAPGVGKSLFALAVASAVAHDVPAVAGMPVSGGAVVLIDAENGERTLHERAHLVGLPADRVRVGLPGTFDLRRADGFADLSSALQDAALLTLDSLASLAPGLKENDANQAGPVLDRLRRLAQDTDAEVLLLHHARKEGDTYRGGTALPAAVDVLAIYARDDNDRDRRVLTWAPERGGKMRLASEPTPRWLRVTVTSDRLTIDQAEPPPDDRDRPPTVRDALRDRLITVIAEHGPIRQSDALRRIGHEPSDATGRRALRDALQQGQLQRHDDGRYTTVSHRDTPTDNGLSPHLTPLTDTPTGRGVSHPGPYGPTRDDTDDPVPQPPAPHDNAPTPSTETTT